MKTAVHQMAAFGGIPMYATPLHVGQPNIPRRDLLLAEFDEILQSGVLTNHGPKVRAFEAAVCRETGARHCIAICNATTALQIAAKALGLKGEVIMPAFTFIATAHAMEWIGLTPVFADVDPASHTLDPKSVESCISPLTSAILPVHLWGHVCDVGRLAEIASEHRLKILFDSSHAFGCRLRGVQVGGFGDAEVFSFHATKFINCCEGGAVVTNNDELAERCRRLRGFGITNLTEISDIGINGKMQELSAAAGLVSLNSLSEILAVNQRNRLHYQVHLAEIPGLTVVSVPPDCQSNQQYLVTLVDESLFGLGRDCLIELLRAEGIFARSYFVPGCHRAVPYAQTPTAAHLRTSLPVTERLLQTVMQLPTGLAVAADDIQIIGRLLRFIAQNGAEISRQVRIRSGNLIGHPADPSKPRDAALREAG